jgi:hypothetical protein
MAGMAAPAICMHCKKSSSISGGLLGAIGALFHFVFLGGAIASLYYWSWWPLIVSFVGYVLTEICVVKWVPLKPLSDEKVKRNKLVAVSFIVILIILVIGAALTDS